MPAVFQTPGSPSYPQDIRVSEGLAARGRCSRAFEASRSRRVTDGTSNTVLIAMARDAVPWTQPGELPFAEGQPLPDLDASNPRGYTLGMADGSVAEAAKKRGEVVRSDDHPRRRRGHSRGQRWKVSQRPDKRIRRHRVSDPAPVYLPTAPQPTPRPATTTPIIGAIPASASPVPAPAAAPGPGMVMASDPIRPVVQHPQALEQRMQRVEEKLDLLLQKIDRLFPDGHPSRR